MMLKAYRFLVSTAVVALLLSVAAAQQPATTGPFTAEQAAAGRTAYQANCAACHQPDLRGSNEAPPLAGSNFMNAWRDRTTSDLFDRIRRTMPADSPGSVGEQETVDIVAYILQANGAPAGTE